MDVPLIVGSRIMQGTQNLGSQLPPVKGFPWGIDKNAHEYK
jgi:hypothetical protein